MMNAPSSAEKVLTASRIGGSSAFRSASLIPWNGLRVSCRLFSMTAVESPMTMIVPTAWPS